MLDGVRLSFLGLMRLAVPLAECLSVRFGVRAGSVVLQCVPRSLEMVVGIAAIQLAGAVYCPVHPSMPVQRIAALAKEADAQVILLRGKAPVSLSSPDSSFYSSSYSLRVAKRRRI